MSQWPWMVTDSLTWGAGTWKPTRALTSAGGFSLPPPRPPFSPPLPPPASAEPPWAAGLASSPLAAEYQKPAPTIRAQVTAAERMIFALRDSFLSGPPPGAGAGAPPGAWAPSDSRRRAGRAAGPAPGRAAAGSRSRVRRRRSAAAVRAAGRAPGGSRRTARPRAAGPVRRTRPGPAGAAARRSPRPAGGSAGAGGWAGRRRRLLGQRVRGRLVRRGRRGLVRGLVRRRGRLGHGVVSVPREGFWAAGAATWRRPSWSWSPAPPCRSGR